MRKRLNITINKDLVEKMKKYATLRETSISHIVEEHFEALLERPSTLHKEMSLVEYVKTLPKSKVAYPKDFDFKKGYYKSKAKGYDEQNPV
ncbi:DUF6364 family protein [Negadavirga shengliensis]|uniref:DUF6364 family protein n=1 Tax=Negadavirga shengliensis TaxID=1389218 RepID=A0ABV9SWE8_9BACT